ncbi:NAD(P)-dependent oxidoreductase [Niabella beijingensis]|uniref:NAD(P)-dependent oxidoreductase n=1 Tax=Niabella beijingensis TaxID=2872700 RepID=UPI001CBD1A5F|nr:NAD(P)-dependent oxidoreductase [Niabella beijingensis]MBZ4191677.1 NAD(P)-dependent oxidoreductase [Niabella beijingensis]
MKIAIIGATGFVGSAVVKEALKRGHVVTALARNTSGIAGADRLTLKNVDVTDETALAEAVKGNDVVISAFNAGWGNPNLYADFLAGSRHIEAAVEKAGVKRLIVVGGAGSLFIDGKQLVDGPDFPQEYKAGATAARDYLDIIRANQQLDWTFFSPAIEMHPGIDAGRTGKYRLGTEAPVFDDKGRSTLSVEDLAVVLVDEAEKAAHIGKRFTAAY